MEASGYERLGEILTACGDIAQKDWEAFLKRNCQPGVRLGELLVDEGHVSADQVARAICLRYDLDIARFELFPMDTSAVLSVPEDLARHHLVVPLRRTGSTLHCATADPADQDATEAIESAADCNLQYVISTPNEILAELDRRYCAVSTESALPIQPGSMFLHYWLVNVRWNEPTVAFYEADDTRLLRRVLVAVVRPSTNEEEFRRSQRFLEHSMWLARFPHRNILTIHDVGEVNGLRFVVSESLPGETIRERLDREHRLSVSSVCELGLQICEALRYLHGSQLVYQSLSPSNCVILAGEELRLTHLDIKLSPSEQLNKSTIPVEDYRYLSPEQLAGLPMDQRSDIFSLGTLLFETTVGRPAFPGNSVAAVSQMVMEGAVVPSEDLPAQLNRLILRACAKERHGRFPDTLSLSEELLTQHWPDLSGDAGVAEYLSDSHRRRAG